MPERFPLTANTNTWTGYLCLECLRRTVARSLPKGTPPELLKFMEVSHIYSGNTQQAMLLIMPI